MASTKDKDLKKIEKVVNDFKNREDYLEGRQKRIDYVEAESRDFGREIGRRRQKEAAGSGGIGTPLTYVKRAGQFIGDKFDDADAYVSGKLGMEERAAYKRGMREGLKDEGYKKGGKVKAKTGAKKYAGGGSVSSASKRADGCATKGKTKGRFV